MKSSIPALALIAAGLVGGLVFAQTGGSLPAPENFVPPAPGNVPAAPPQSGSNQPSANQPSATPGNQPPVDQPLGSQPPTNQLPPPSSGMPTENAPMPSSSSGAGGNVPPPMTPPPKDQGIKTESSSIVIPPSAESSFKIHRPPEPFDFEGSSSYDETKKRDIFYYRLITDLYRLRDGSGPGDADSGQDPLIQWDLDNFDVLGIMWDVAKPKAILRDPLGRYHNLTKGMKIGVHGGAVIGIREGEIIVMEYTEEEDRVVKKPRVMVIKNKSK